MQFLSPSWPDYELIDCGGGKKLERFGDIILVRPEVTATWQPRLPSAQWASMPHASFRQKGSRSGEWIVYKEVHDHWRITAPLSSTNIKLKLSLTKFKHVGLFPEQFFNWQFIEKQCAAKPGSKVLNLFAYTGGASVVAKAAGADVTHVDSIKQVVSWARMNMEENGLSDIRWIVDDALKFARKEQRRGNRYDGIIMDPPSYGHGPKGERWKVEQKIEELVKTTCDILEPNGWLILNTYSGLDEKYVRELVKKSLPNRKIESGPLVLQSTHGDKIYTGTLLRVIPG
jgi:23S rRNA (cytosine1962-C5)-methyltransferase